MLLYINLESATFTLSAHGDNRFEAECTLALHFCARDLVVAIICETSLGDKSWKPPAISRAAAQAQMLLKRLPWGDMRSWLQAQEGAAVDLIVLSNHFREPR